MGFLIGISLLHLRSRNEGGERSLDGDGQVEGSLEIGQLIPGHIVDEVHHVINISDKNLRRRLLSQILRAVDQ